MNAPTPSPGVPTTSTSRRRAQPPPHITSTAWWLAYVGALVVVGLLALVLFLS